MNLDDQGQLAAMPASSFRFAAFQVRMLANPGITKQKVNVSALLFPTTIPCSTIHTSRELKLHHSDIRIEIPNEKRDDRIPDTRPQHAGLRGFGSRRDRNNSFLSSSIHSSIPMPTHLIFVSSIKMHHTTTNRPNRCSSPQGISKHKTSFFSSVTHLYDRPLHLRGLPQSKFDPRRPRPAKPHVRQDRTTELNLIGQEKTRPQNRRQLFPRKDVKT